MLSRILQCQHAGVRSRLWVDDRVRLGIFARALEPFPVALGRIIALWPEVRHTESAETMADNRLLREGGN